MKFPQCGECGGEVILQGGVRRQREIFHGVHVTVPDDFEIPTCTRCGETMMIPEISAVLDAMLRKQLSPEAVEVLDQIQFGSSPEAKAMRADATDMLREKLGRKH